MSEDLLYMDSQNWRALKKFGADLSTDLNSASGTEPSDGNWRVVNTGPLKWDIYHPAIQIMDGSGSPLQVEIQNQDAYNEGTPDFWVLVHNRVRQLNSSKVIMKFDKLPKVWPIGQLVAEIGNWLREAKLKIESLQNSMMPDMSVSQVPPGGSGPPAGGGSMGLMASRKERLARRLCALERNPLETVSTNPKDITDVGDDLQWIIGPVEP